MQSGLAQATLSPSGELQAVRHSHDLARWWAVAGRFLLHGLIVSTWISRIPTIKNALNLNNEIFGLALLGTAVGSITAVPVAGWLVTRIGSKRLATWSAVAFSLALVGPSFATGAWSLFLAMIAFGAAAGTNDVSINSQGVALEEALGTPTMSRFHAMFSIGGMLGAAIGGGIASMGISTRTHLAGAAAFLLLLGFVTALRLPETHEMRSAPKAASKSDVFKIPPALVTLALIGFSMFLSEGAIADWSGVYLGQTLQARAGLAAGGYAVFSAAMAIFRLLGDSVTKRFGATNTLRCAALTAAAGLSLALAANTPAVALVGFGLTGVGLSVIVPLVFAASGKIKSVASATGVALVSGCGYVGFLFGPPLIGLVAHHGSLREALFIPVALSLLAAGLAPALRAGAR